MVNELKDIQKTLLLPLWGRAKLSKMGNPVLNDPKAVEIVDRMTGYDFESIQKIFTDFFNVGWITRAKMFDETIRDFLSVHPEAVIVNLGAGLDTTYFRVDNGRLRWYDLDLPDVIAVRKKLIPEDSRYKCIAVSLFDPAWTGEIQAGVDNTLFLAGGVLYYFPEGEVKGLFRLLADNFPGCEAVFDTVSEIGLAVVNKGLRAAGHDESAFLKWGLSDAQTLCRWDPRIEVLEEYPLFSRLEDIDFWDEKIVQYIAQSDKTRSSNIVHVRFTGR
jgi:O-methyltransferase involved in polyketide biosynthesis